MENIFKKFINNSKKQEDSEEIKKLEELKIKIKAIRTVEELEAMEEELIALGVLDKSKLDKLKRKKKKRKSDREIFEERVRCDLETINKVILVGKIYKKQERKREDKELIQNRDDREKTSGVKDKEKEKDKEERTRSSGGRTRGDR